MTKELKSARIGVYECSLSGDYVSKGKRVKGYYGLFTRELVNSTILPDLKDSKRAGWDFDFPVLVVSYRLGPGDTPKPYTGPVPSGKSLTIESVGGLRNLKKVVGIPVARKKIPQTERWEAIIDERGQVLEVEGDKVKAS